MNTSRLVNWQMAMSTKPLPRPSGMKGHFVRKITRNIGVAYVFASAVTYSWYFGVQKIRRDVYAEFRNDFHNDIDEDDMYQRIKSKGLFWAIFYKCVYKKSLKSTTNNELYFSINAYPYLTFCNTS